MTPLPDETTPREGDTDTTGTSQGDSWDTASAKSSYANVCNVVSTREEVVLNFGLNQIWARNRENRAVRVPLWRAGHRLNILAYETHSSGMAGPHGFLKVHTAYPRHLQRPCNDEACAGERRSACWAYQGLRSGAGCLQAYCISSISNAVE
jgi:hypothetical protein